MPPASNHFNPNDPISQLVWLAHEIGREDRGLVILNEGSVSTRVAQNCCAIKVAGTALATLTREQVVECDTEKVCRILDLQFLNPTDLAKELSLTRLRLQSPMPSSESCLHAWLLQQEGVNFVAHCHPEACLQVLCSPGAEKFAENRCFVDEIYSCGSRSVFVPYADPGVALAREVRSRFSLFTRQNQGRPPRLVLLQNHGILALGPSPEAVLSTVLNAERSARILVGSARLGGVVFLPSPVCRRIEEDQVAWKR